MKNIPRIYINTELKTGAIIVADQDTAHYLTRVMRLKSNDLFLVFNSGVEYNAKLEIVNTKKGGAVINILDKTLHADASNNLILAFAPIKQARLEEMLNMATQMGVATMIPVVTEYTTAKHINWDRIQKIVTESSEQSGRNSIPVVLAPVKISDFIATNGKNIIYADERFAHDGDQKLDAPAGGGKIILIGPEGGFSDTEFAALQKAGATPISLGRTILRAETAAIVAISKILG